jgi:hypothetical protein
MSDRVGQSISGNGGMLTFGFDLDIKVNALATKQATSQPVGPTIIGCVNCRDTKDVEDGFVIQEGTFPPIAAVVFKLICHLLESSHPRNWKLYFSPRRLLSRWLCSSRAMASTQMYLSLGHDNACGRLQLEKDGRTSLDMRGVQDNRKLSPVKELLARMTHNLGGVFKPFRNKCTVHPLGGVTIAGDGTGRTGCLSHACEVLTGVGNSVHPGLAVVDGTAVPRSLGSNPMATIAALAERSVEILARQSGLNIDFTTKSTFEETWKVRYVKQSPSIMFAETMAGNLLINGKPSPASLEMYVELEKGSQVSAPWTGNMSGELKCSALSSEPFIIRRGTFCLSKKTRLCPAGSQ